LETVNAIARVRFSSARPQVVQLHKPGVAHVELLCMEAGQKLTVDKTPVVYYVITGSASIASAGKTVVAAAGHTVSLDTNETHVVVSPPEGRLVCLMITT
jgi:mannose-6-phosphate isomerase-like protein (cupin superfamily)